MNARLSKESVVVTGLGVMHELGSSVDAFWRAVIDGQDAAHEPDHFDVSKMKIKRSIMLSRQSIAKASLPSEKNSDILNFGIHAARNALANARATELCGKSKIGLCIGTTSGGETDDFSNRVRLGERRDAGLAEKAFVFSSAHAIHKSLNLGGSIYNFSQACTSSAMAILRAVQLIQKGQSEVVLCGGVDRVRGGDFAGFAGLRAMAHGKCTPFGETREGLIMADGAAFLVLESADHAQKRGAPVLAELIGCGASSDSFHATAPHPRGITAAMQSAMEKLQEPLHGKLYINAHGTGTKLNDAAEINAINDVFSTKIDQIYVSSTKSITGHMLGSAGAIEALITVKSLETGQIPMSANTRDIDPAVNFNLVTKQVMQYEGEYAMSNSLGFGGTNVSLLFRKVSNVEVTA